MDYSENHRSDVISLNGLNSKEKLQTLADLLNSLPNGFHKNILFNLRSLYYAYSHKGDAVTYTIDRKIEIAFESLSHPDSYLSDLYGIPKSLINGWRNDVVIVLYFLFKLPLIVRLGKKIDLDEAIESTPTYLKLLRMQKETDMLLQIVYNKEIGELIKKIPYMNKLIFCFIQYNSIEEYLIELNIIERSNDDFGKRMSAYNKMFRSFFFENGNTFGFLKLYKMIFWSNKLIEKNFEKTLAYQLMIVYSFTFTELGKRIGSKYYLVKKTIEWLMKNEQELSEASSKFKVRTVDSDTPLESYLQRNFTRGLLPSFLMRLLHLLSKDPEAQTIIAKSLDLKVTDKEKVTTLGTFFGFLENALLDVNYKMTRENVESHLSLDRNYILNTLRDLIVEFRRKQNQPKDEGEVNILESIVNYNNVGRNGKQIKVEIIKDKGYDDADEEDDIEWDLYES